MNKIIALLVICGIVAYLVYTQGAKAEGDSFFQPMFYDKYGNPMTLGVLGAVVNNVQNVEYIKFKMVIKNVGDIPLTASVSSITAPTSIKTELQKFQSTTIDPGNTYTWVNPEFIPVDTIGAGDTTVDVTMKLENVKWAYSGTKSASTKLSISINPNTEFTISPTTSGDSTSVGGIVWYVYSRDSAGTLYACQPTTQLSNCPVEYTGCYSDVRKVATGCDCCTTSVCSVSTKWSVKPGSSC